MALILMFSLFKLLESVVSFMDLLEQSYNLRSILNIEIRARGYTTLFMLISAQHELLNARKYKISRISTFFQAQISPEC